MDIMTNVWENQTCLTVIVIATTNPLILWFWIFWFVCPLVLSALLGAHIAVPLSQRFARNNSTGVSTRIVFQNKC